MPDDEVGFADFVLPLVRRRKLIVRIVGVAAVGSVVAALLWPQTWRAGVTVLPPERRMDNPLFVPGGFEQIGSTLRGIALRQIATPTDIFIAILESRNVGEAIVERFGLMEEYDVRTMSKAIKELEKNIDVSTTREGLIGVSATAASADLAANIANALVEELDRVNLTLANREATSTREFVETELEEAKGRLATAEDELRRFQERYGAIEVAEQARAVIAAAAEIRAKILMAEVELGVLRRTHDASHPDVKRAEDYLAEMRLRLAEIEGQDDPLLASGDDVDRPGEGGVKLGEPAAPTVERDVFPPLSRVPALGLQFGRLYREMKTEETVVMLLTEQYHKTRIEERRSLPTVRVLDPAVPPERRFRPRRTILVLVTTGAAMLLAAMLAYSLEIVHRIRHDPVRYGGLHDLADDLRKGIRN